MFQKGSRYEKCATFTAPQDGGDAFPGIRARQISPARGQVEHVVKSGDRLDLLALYYYNDDRLWWRIVDANPGYLFGNDMMLDSQQGSVILIPKAKE